MKFLDANPFIYAYYKPGRRLSENEKKLKERAKEVITRINRGEKVVTTVIHLSEIVNILKHGMSPNDLLSLITSVLSSDNVNVLGVSREDYLNAVGLASELKLDPNDSLAVYTMKNMEIKKIYSFDLDFDNVEGIKRLP